MQGRALGAGDRSANQTSALSLGDPSSGHGLLSRKMLLMAAECRQVIIQHLLWPALDLLLITASGQFHRTHCPGPQLLFELLASSQPSVLDPHFGVKLSWFSFLALSLTVTLGNPSFLKPQFPGLYNTVNRNSYFTGLLFYERH